MSDFKAEIIKDIQSLSGSRSPYQIFTDWVQCMAYALENSCHPFFHDARWKKQEEEYLQIITGYKDKGERFSRMYANLEMALTEEIKDILGEVYMESGCGSKITGQFFTPFHVSKMMARLSLNDIDLSKPITLHEPSCGAGGAIIATAAGLKERGINYQRSMDVVAQDLDWKAVYMTYVQLSLLGIKAIVVQGDTLAEPYTGKGYPQERVFYTPAKIWRIY